LNEAGYQNYQAVNVFEALIMFQERGADLERPKMAAKVGDLSEGPAEPAFQALEIQSNSLGCERSTMRPEPLVRYCRKSESPDPS
jgi:hypothetical protein